MSLVLDCSVTIAWFFRDEQNPAGLALLERVLVEGATVPGIWRYEVAHVLLKAERRGRLATAARDALLAHLSALDIQVDPDWEANLWTSTVRIAEHHGLTVYDASYLELAQRRRLSLATTDEALRRAAAAERVALA